MALIARSAFGPSYLMFSLHQVVSKLEVWPDGDWVMQNPDLNLVVG